MFSDRPENRKLRLRQDVRLALVCVFLGLLGGLLEAAVVIIQRFGFRQAALLGPQIVWMSPLAVSVFAALPGIAGYVVLRRLAPNVAWRVGVGVTCFLVLWGLALFVPRLHYAAAAVLAGGLSVQIAQRLLREDSALARRAVRAVALAVGLVAVLGGGLNAWLWATERWRVSSLRELESTPPNVLLIVLDTERAESLRLYGNPRPTSPVLEELAREGVVFEYAIAPSAWTLPTHATLFTGRYPHELSVDWRVPLDGTTPTLAAVLRDAGYFTAGFVANTFYCVRDRGLARGFIYYDDYVVSPSEFLLSSSVLRTVLHLGTVRRLIRFTDLIGRPYSSDITQSFLRWLDGTTRRPFFAFLNYFDAHEPYAPAPAEERAFLGHRRRDFSRAVHAMRVANLYDWRWAALSDSAKQVGIDSYEAAILTVDRALGRLVAALRERGELDRTVLIITSDHGEQFGEHRRHSNGVPLFTHGSSLYSQLVWVPLLVRYPPAVPAGLRVPDPVSLRDIPATIGALSGAFGPGVFPGTSLSTLWIPGAPEDRRVSPALATVHPYDELRNPKAWIASLVEGSYHYIRFGLGFEELYNVVADPAERVDLSGSPEGKNVLPRLSASLDRALAGARLDRDDRAHAKSK